MAANEGQTQQSTSSKAKNSISNLSGTVSAKDNPEVSAS